MLPVLGRKDNNAYKNVFCAKCNHVSNQKYWKFSASCVNLQADDIPSNRSLMLEFVIENWEWRFKEPSDKYQNLKKFLAVEQRRTDSVLVEKEPLLPVLCSFYVFPDCGKVWIKNPLIAGFTAGMMSAAIIVTVFDYLYLNLNHRFRL